MCDRRNPSNNGACESSVDETRLLSKIYRHLSQRMVVVSRFQLGKLSGSVVQAYGLHMTVINLNWRIL